MDGGAWQSRPGHENSGSSFQARLAADPDLHVVVQSIEEMHEPFSGEACKSVVAQRRDIRLLGAKLFCSFVLGEVFKDPINGNGQTDLGLFLVGVTEVEVPKNVPGPRSCGLFSSFLLPCLSSAPASMRPPKRPASPLAP